MLHYVEGPLVLAKEQFRVVRLTQDLLYDTLSADGLTRDIRLRLFHFLEQFVHFNKAHLALMLANLCNLRNRLLRTELIRYIVVPSFRPLDSA